MSAVKKESNGSLKPVKTETSFDNGHAVVPELKAVPAVKRQSSVAWLVSTIFRLFVYFSIYTLIFRCPSSVSDVTEDTPRICKPYFQIKEYLGPHVAPYYEKHAAPYVAAAKPYYDTVDEKVLTPGREYAVKYAAPQVAKAQAYSQDQWSKNVQPHLERAQTVVAEHYGQNLAPHVDRASAAVGPYYEAARVNALQTHQDVVLPAYEKYSPYAAEGLNRASTYAQQGYSSASTFATDTAAPSAVRAWQQVNVFLDETVWPKLHILYIETVAPQLEKIGQRLGRYSDNAQLETQLRSINNAAPSSFTKPTPSSALSKTGATTTGQATSSATPQTQPDVTEAVRMKAHEPVAAPDTPESGENEERRLARETVAEDLKAWQEKYTKAADEGAVEIEQGVEEISKKMIQGNAKTIGKSHLEELQQSVATELEKLRADIIKTVGAVSKGASTPKEGEEQILTDVRRAGVEIKQKAQDVRTWREGYSQELQASVTHAAENHFKILGSIRDLALQKIGMKWAWMEGVTYKDWAKYHQLKDRFDEWENDLEQLIVTHPGLAEAQSVAQGIEDEAMTVAQSAAKELTRLKDVGGWKIVAEDTSDEFDSEKTKAAAEEAESKAAEAVAAAKVVEAAQASEAAEAAKAAEASKAAEAASSSATAAESTETTEAAGTVVADDEVDAAKTVGVAEAKAIKAETIPEANESAKTISRYDEETTVAASSSSSAISSSTTVESDKPTVEAVSSSTTSSETTSSTAETSSYDTDETVTPETNTATGAATVSSSSVAPEESTESSEPSESSETSSSKLTSTSSITESTTPIASEETASSSTEEVSTSTVATSEEEPTEDTSSASSADETSSTTSSSSTATTSTTASTKSTASEDSSSDSSAKTQTASKDEL